jgi:gamma-glutamylcyclotransferase
LLYFAYGSNLWRKQMALRCPEQVFVGTGSLRGWRWIITTRGYASIVRSAEDYVLGSVYELSDSDVLNLDRFEGVAFGDYSKEMILIQMAGREVFCLVYIDQVVEEGRPKEEYIVRVNYGIDDAGFPDEYISRYLRPFVPLRPER